jgi:deoxyribodipyrimidine photo-lyase
MSAAIWWIRRDLRLHDNQALAAALAQGGLVLPVFIITPGLVEGPHVAPRRLAFLWGGLAALAADLERRGSRLLVRRGEPLVVLQELMATTGATAIFAEADYSPYARRRDEAVARALPLRLCDGLTVYPPAAIVRPDGKPYVVYTPFSRAWKAQPPPAAPLPAPAFIPTVAFGRSEPLPAATVTSPFPPGEAEARRRLAAFVGGERPPIYHYAEERNRLDRAGTSQLSPYFRFGMLSARTAVHAAYEAIAAAPDAEARKGAEAWLNELIWREFYIAILYHHPFVLRRAFRADLRAILWQEDEAAFRAWCEGRTGYPIVDAAMRELAATGWMHNRGRMIVASFLVKDLLIDWRWGERWFMQTLVDGDPAANNGGWQWTAGTGTDAAPYFRIFNPVVQSAKCDPEGTYIRRWVPELARVPTAYIHAPWQMPPDVQRQSGCVIGRDYPAPLVDHAWARVRALAAYAQAQNQANERAAEP